MPKPKKTPAAPEKVQEANLTRQLAAAADALYQARVKRLALQKEVDNIAKEEARHREFIIENLSKSQAGGIKGRVARAELKTKRVVRIENWDEFSAFVLKNKRLDLLQRRPSDAAIEELWEARKKVPGAEPFDVVSVSCTKI